MMRLFGLVLAGGMILGAAGEADAQVAISIGNPYYGRGLYVGAPAYAYPPPMVAAPVVAAPLVAPPVVGVGVGLYPRYPVYRPYYGPRPYGYYRRW